MSRLLRLNSGGHETNSITITIEICEGIQEWKKASTTLQFLVKEVQQLSAKQNARGEDTIQEKDDNEESEYIRINTRITWDSN